MLSIDSEYSLPIAPIEWMTIAITPANGPSPTTTAITTARISVSIERRTLNSIRTA